MLILKPIKIALFLMGARQFNLKRFVVTQYPPKKLHGTKRCIQHLEHTLFCSIGIFCNANGLWHEAWGGKLWVSNVLQPFERSARQPCLHYFSACGEIPGLKVFVTASGTVEQDTCSIIVDCRLKSPDKVEKNLFFFQQDKVETLMSLSAANKKTIMYKV